MIYNLDMRLLKFLRSRQGIKLSELDITAPLRISHGTFVAARKRLIDEGKISYSRIGRKLIFQVLIPGENMAAGFSAAAPIAPPAAPAAPGKASEMPLDDSAAILAAEEPAPRVEGWFSDVDEWVEVMIQRLGDVAVDQLDDSVYSVTIMATLEEQVYRVAESAGGIEVS